MNNQRQTNKHRLRKPIFTLLLFGSIFLLSGCYSIILSNKLGTPEPDPMQDEPGFYRKKEVITIDTVMKLGLIENELVSIERCPNGFHSVEYRVTLWGLVISTLSLGKRRLVQVKYVCIKESNE